MCVVWLSLAVPSGVAAAAAPLAPGVIHTQVICRSDPAQSYTLYVPTNYRPERPWPIIYAFDFAARGRVPVEMLREAAEKYGYIVAGLNNARNFAEQEMIAAARAISRDTSERFLLDPRRVYLTGLSGGARLAAGLALNCNGCAAGVIGHGAGFPPSVPPTEGITFVYFGTVGDADTLRNDPTFAPLYGAPDFRRLIVRLKTEP